MYYVSINKHVIRSNINNPDPAPPVRISRGKSGKGEYCFECELPAGSRVVYSSDKPLLKCGARLVIECPTEPRIIR